MRILSSSLLSAASLLPSLALAISFDCSKIIADGQKYDLSALGGVHEIYHAEKIDDTVVNTTYVLDLCNVLGNAALRGDPVANCGRTRNICGFQYKSNDGTHWDSDAFPIFGLESMGQGTKDAKVSQLATDDWEKGGLEVKMSGGEYPVDGKKKPAGADIQFLCDPEKSGLEGLVKEEPKKLRAREDEDGGDGEGDGDGDDKEPFLDGSDPNRSLQFKGFNKTEDDEYVLNLSWRTRYACEDYADNRGSSSNHWGFFTWLIIIFFLCAAAYLIFGSWLNYNRYGARGWDLLPHGDTIRDVPYLFQDWLRRVVNTFQGSGSRGGYSAV
ncbi:autophagy-related protein 27 [Aspergillus unguis]